MVTGRSHIRTRMLKELGSNMARWRKLQGLSATMLAERAHVTRDTLRAIETGTGAPRIDSLPSLPAPTRGTRSLVGLSWTNTSACQTSSGG
jgi:DNA-binding XRE family transcriptional regulator